MDKLQKNEIVKKDIQIVSHLADSSRRFWAFKHKPGVGGASHFRQFLDRAYRLNVCMMQYEYGHQGPAEVTRNWNVALRIKEGDVVFLRGDDCLYAYGVVVAHGLAPGGDVIVSKSTATIENNSHGEGNKLQSSDYHGFVVFEESNVFYEDLRDGPDEWGQRIKVEQWVCYCKEGINCKSLENYINPDRYSAVMELKSEAALRFLEELTKRSCDEKGIDSMTIRLLERNMNLVLTGAPGTGKTYLAREMGMMLSKSKDRILNVQFHPSYGYSDFVEGLRPVKKEGSSEIGFERRDGVFMEFCRKALEHLDENYVVIIDEINRGDISKIFGELFSLIEPDYRSSDGKDKNGNFVAVKTQYANLMTKVDVFKAGFFVPPNVYIIGTMNDVDRSVESMDFAIRRRFVWHEIKPMDRFDAMWGDDIDGVDKEDAKRRMVALNEYIKNDPSLGDAYQIGPSYFVKLKVLKCDYQLLWEQRLELLLKEYLRGIPDAQARLEKLRSILFNVTESGHVQD